MAIDGKIATIRYGQNYTTVILRQRVPDQLTGADRLEITLNPDYTPQLRDEIWGNGSTLMIRDHSFGRIRKNYDGSRYVDFHPLQGGAYVEIAEPES